MINELIKIDQQIFEAINIGFGNLFFDWLMPILRNKLTWIPLYLFIIGFALKTYKVKGLYLILFFATTVGIADYGSSSLLKPTFNRIRPCNDTDMQNHIISRVPCGSGKSFPSSHATDHFAIAIFLIIIFAKKWNFVLPACLVWASSICFAQVYVGVHYPIDVFVGAIFGSLVGFAGARLFLKFIPLNI
jgi:membrane-associated phospholipid phosphatase